MPSGHIPCIRATFRGGPSRADLERIRDEEQRHLAIAAALVATYAD